MSLKQDVQTLKDIFDGMTGDEKNQARVVVAQLGFLQNIFERSEGLLGALTGIAFAAKVRGPERVKETFEAIFGRTSL